MNRLAALALTGIAFAPPPTVADRIFLNGLLTVMGGRDTFRAPEF